MTLALRSPSASLKRKISFSPQNVLKSPATMTGFRQRFDQLIQVAQLEVPMAVLQGQMHQKNGEAVELELDDEPLDAGVEVVESLSRHARTGEKCVGLLAQDGQVLVHRLLAVLALIGGVMPERLGDGLGLIDAAAADGADVDLDQADDVRDPPA